MSYEGYEQQICVNGHYQTGPDSWHIEDEAKCHCGATIAWYNAVDETNCNSYGEIPMELINEKFRISDDVVEVCNLKHSHVIKEAVYRIPTKEESDPLRHYRDGDGRAPLIPIASRKS